MNQWSPTWHWRDPNLLPHTGEHGRVKFMSSHSFPSLPSSASSPPASNSYSAAARPPSMAELSHLSWWRFQSLVRIPSFNGPRRPMVPAANRVGRVSADIGHFRGAANYREKVFLKCQRRGAGKFSSFTRPHGKVSCSAASSIIGKSDFRTPQASGEEPLPSFTWPDNQKPRICILGGGFGGLYTALRLESLIWPDDKKPQVLLVDQSDCFVFKPMLYELLSGEVDAWEIAPSFSDLLKNTSVQFVKDRVKLLDPCDHLNHCETNGSGRLRPGGKVYLESGIIIEYDWLVLALGAESKLDVVPGSVEFALPFSTLEDACKVDNKLKILERERFGKDSSLIRVAIVGCGYSGVELAATISERLQNKGLVQAINVQATICPTAPPGNRETALKVLQSRNVELLLGYFVKCIKEASISEDTSRKIVNREEMNNEAKACSKPLILELQPAERGIETKVLEADLVLWTVGSRPLVPQSKSSDGSDIVPVNARGQAETDETLRIKGHPRIFAVGDSAALRDSSGRLLPATAQVAFQQADFAGWNLWAAINNRPLLPFRFQNLGEMMTLGRNDAAISPSFIDGLTLDGPLGHTARKITYLLRLPTDKHRIKVGASWLTKSAIDSVASLQSNLTKLLSGL